MHSLKETLIQKLQKKPQVLALPDSLDERVLVALKQLFDWEVLSQVYLFCHSDDFLAECLKFKLDFFQLYPKIVFVTDVFPNIHELVAKRLLQIAQRRGKSLSNSSADERGQNSLFQAAYLLEQKKVAAVVAGAAATTADVIRAGLALLEIDPAVGKINSSFILERPRPGQDNEFLLFSDCGVLINPDVNDLIGIAAASVQTWRSLFAQEIEPKVAFLSFSTKGSADDPQVKKMRQAADIFRAKFPEIAADGELQFDAAYVADIGQRKAPQSPVAGQANCFIFPDLNSGNIAYKIAQRVGGFSAYGPLLQGFFYPYCDLSRGAQVDDIAVTCLINLLRAVE